MKLIFTFIVTFLVSDKVISNPISNYDICIRVQNQCKGFYDFVHKYEIKCEKNACEGKLNYKCNSDYCSLNKFTCDYISKLIFLFRSIKNLHDSKMFEENFKKYSNFINGIKNCSVDVYSLQSDDICIIGDGCYSVTEFSFKFFAKVTKPIKCPCPVKQTFHCGEKFCAIHSDACKVFNQTGSSSNIKNCGNNNIVLWKTI